jgi:hypothetical protein
MRADAEPDTSHDHVVDFYDGDIDLACRTGRFLAEGLDREDVAVAIATLAHLELFATVLVDAGIDVDAAHASGQYVALDADALLSGIVDSTGVNLERFDATLGRVLEDAWDTAAKRGGRVRLFGEMVQLLWERGDVSGALEFEARANALSMSTGLSVLCAYASSVVDDDPIARERIGAFHTGVVDMSAVSRPAEHEGAEFDPHVDSATAARRFVWEVCGRWGLHRVAADAGLIASELSTNAIMHARTSFRVVVARVGSVVRIAVHDADPQLPVVLRVDAVTPTGRGIPIVSALATEWGSEQTIGGGKVVWAELAT